MYLTNTRLDICFVVNTLSKYMVNLVHIHIAGEKHVMRYLKGTLDYGLIYASNGEGSIKDKEHFRMLFLFWIKYDLMVQ